MPDTPLRPGRVACAELAEVEASEAVRPATPSANGPPAPASIPPAPPESDASDSPAGRGIFKTFYSLRFREFRFLWLGMVFLMMGMQMQMIVRGYLTYEITSSPFILGLVNAGFAVPMLSLALFGGAVADRMERKRVIQIGQCLAIVLALFVGISIVTDTVTWMHLLFVSMVQGAQFSFLMPARQALVPQLVGRENLTNAMSLDAAAMSVTTLIAPSVGGVLYSVIGPEGVYFLVAGLGVVAVVFTSMVSARGGSANRPSVPMASDIMQGLRYVVNSPVVLILLVMGLATALLAMPFRFLMPVFVVDVYERGPESLGLLVTIMGMGSLVGALFIATLGKKKRGLLLLAGSCISAIALMLVAAIPLYYAAAGLMILLGLGDAGRRTLNQALIMEEVDDQYRGRVMSVFMMNFGLMPLGVLPAGALAERFGGQFAVMLLGVLLLLTTIAVLATQRRLRELD